MTTKYQRQFELNRTEMEIIEIALRSQVSDLSKQMLDQQVASTQDKAGSTSQLSSRMKEIQSVLGNLHNQKNWFRPQDAVPLG